MLSHFARANCWVDHEPTIPLRYITMHRVSTYTAYLVHPVHTDTHTNITTKPPQSQSDKDEDVPPPAGLALALALALAPLLPPRPLPRLRLLPSLSCVKQQRRKTFLRRRGSVAQLPRSRCGAGDGTCGRPCRPVSSTIRLRGRRIIRAGVCRVDVRKSIGELYYFLL